MENEIKMILEEGNGFYEEKKSRFLACIRPVKTQEEALAFIEEKKKQYWDARHNCSAYRIGTEQPVAHCSDDGEPSGTAGRPMLEVLTREGLTNVVAVVTRYFGGVLLGTGGLVRAYQASLKDAKVGSSFQFMRLGYFCPDSKDSSAEHLVFNRSVGLKDSFKPGK